MFDDLNKTEINNQQQENNNSNRSAPETAPFKPAGKPQADDFKQRLEKLRNQGKRRILLKRLILIIVLGFAVGIVAAGYFYWPEIVNFLSQPGRDQVVCALDAKQCPDGSFVSRQAPDCAFAPCPEINGEQPVGDQPVEAVNPADLPTEQENLPGPATIFNCQSDTDCVIKEGACGPDCYQIDQQPLSGAEVDCLDYQPWPAGENCLCRNNVCARVPTDLSTNDAAEILVSDLPTPADWQTYRNEEWGFEVEYPEDWGVVDEINYVFVKLKDDIYFGVLPTGGLDYSLPSSDPNINNVIINGRAAVRNDWSLNDDKILIHIYFEDFPDKWGENNRLDITGFKNNIGIYNQIISTFKFLQDSDSDGLFDDVEAQYGTDINNPDSDGDGFFDGEEVNNGYNPLGPGRL